MEHDQATRDKPGVGTVPEPAKPQSRNRSPSNPRSESSAPGDDRSGDEPEDSERFEPV